jgi:hypothetical protein
MHNRLYALVALVVLTTVACRVTNSGNSVSEPKAAVAPITIGSDLTKIDVCQAIPLEDMQAVMGRKLISDPEPFTYYDTPGTSGCMYDGGKDAQGNAYYAYVVFTPVDVYDNQPVYKDVVVSGIGESAYFNNGADTRQLWVKISPTAAFVVANGDSPNEAGLKALARLIAAVVR